MIGVPARLFESSPGMALQQTGSGSIISVRYWDLVFEFEIATVSIGTGPLVFLGLGWNSHDAGIGTGSELNLKEPGVLEHQPS